MLRVKNLIKRNIDPEITQTIYSIGDVVVDFNSFELKSKTGNQIELTQKQIKLLKLFPKKLPQLLCPWEVVLGVTLNMFLVAIF